ncbi:MAG: sugar phosphate nucleotidyltransferase [Bacillota bacterium]
MKILIMAGGQGTRFWPRSVNAFPKQFLALTSEETTLRQTYRRFLQWLPIKTGLL